MKFKFVKMQSLGNDFLVLNQDFFIGGKLRLDSTNFKFLADRRLGVGADQILLIKKLKDQRGDIFEYRIFNADGKEVEQCGNGARCIFKFIKDHNLSDKDKISLSCRAGLIDVEKIGDDFIRVEMTTPKPGAKEIGFNVKGLEKNQFKNHEAYWVPWQSQFKFCLFPVSIGNPHVVCWVDDLYSPRVSEFADWIMMSKMFSSGVNLEICKLISTTEIQMRVFERGVGETSACGTGACAAAVSGICLEKLQSETDIIVNVCLGYMIVSWSGSSEDSVFLSGPAKTVFTGEIDIEQ